MVRSKYRYISLKIASSKRIREQNTSLVIKNDCIFQAILSKVRQLHGDYGVAIVKMCLICKYCNEMTGVAVVKVRHVAHKFVSTVIPFIKNIGSESVTLTTLRTTSTLRQAYKHLKIHQQREFEKQWNSLDSETRIKLQEKYCDLSKFLKLVSSQEDVKARK